MNRRLNMGDTGSGFKAGANVVPTFVVMFFGVGLASGLAHMPHLVTVLTSLVVFAAPAQFAMADVAHQGGGIIQMITIAIVVNLRFFVMSLTLASTFTGNSRLTNLVWCPFISATTYLTTFFHWRAGRVADPFAFYQGVVLAVLPAALIGTAVGMWFGTGMPALMAFGATLFLPVYFSLMLAGEKQTRNESAAVVLGFLLTPLVEVVLPGWGLFVVALTVGLALNFRAAPAGEESGGAGD
ncbi:MAG: AzlC family ABC transporter permease [Arenicellales bacterium]|jgi:predicted branched-subunit amino acid permease